jgi:hypothetical protein
MDKTEISNDRNKKHTKSFLRERERKTFNGKPPVRRSRR